MSLVGAGAGSSAYVMSHAWTLAEGSQSKLDTVIADVHKTQTDVAVLNTHLSTIQSTLAKMDTKVEKLETTQQLQLAMSLLLIAGMGHMIITGK